MESNYPLRFQNFFDDENDMLCVSENHKNFTFVSSKWEKVLDMSLAEINATPLEALIHPEDWEKTKEMFKTIKEKHKVFGFENRYITSKKEIRWLKWRLIQEERATPLYFGIATDVTELREREHDLKMTQLQAKLGTWNYHESNDRFFYSEEIYKIYEIDPSKFSHLHANELHDEASWSKLTSAFHECLTEGISWDHEIKVITPQGKTKWIRSWGFPKKTGDDIVGIEGLMQDLTERKKEELILRQAVEELDKIQLSINQHCLMARLNADAYFLDVNHIFEKTSGYTLPELLGKRFTALAGSSRFMEKFQDIYRLLCKGQKWRGEFHQKGKDGQSFWLDMSMTPIMNLSENRLREIICICYDITEKKLNDERYQTVLSGINAGIWDWPDISSSALYWSPKLYEIVDHSPHDFSSDMENFLKMVHPDDIERVQGGINRLIEFNHPFLPEFRLLGGSGKYKWIQALGIAIRDDSGKAYRVIGSMIDINQKKLIESNLEEEKQKTVQASKLATLGEMAAGLAHEVNNPLTIIFGYIRVLEEEIHGPQLNYESFHKTLGLIKNAAERAAKIVNNLKDFARDGSGDPFEDSPASHLISMVLDLCRERFKKNGVRLEVEIATDPIVYCRKIELSQVILNLLFNSFDAVQELENKWVKITALKQNGFIEISITDSGPGLIPEVAERIFTPFFTTKKRGLGTGLGLSISQRIILNHGGEIAYDPSSLNTKFIIKLPLYYELT